MPGHVVYAAWPDFFVEKALSNIITNKKSNKQNDYDQTKKNFPE